MIWKNTIFRAIDNINNKKTFSYLIIKEFKIYNKIHCICYVVFQEIEFLRKIIDKNIIQHNIMIIR